MGVESSQRLMGGDETGRGISMDSVSEFIFHPYNGEPGRDFFKNIV